ncbi:MULTISPECIES: hypothetical protein [unclassified Streptomyces]|uniref:hypothetical protein n=1 Tax=unclassified Streptomyces TaxID=2593676 RepID=UPI002E27FB41|nr:hypothetical protein [Streptomyces sp. NBC_00228]
MAARKPADDAAAAEDTETPAPPKALAVDETPETEEQPNAAIVAPRQYAGGPGWDIGKAAPEDAFRALDLTGREQVGPVVHTHPGGYARQIVAKGGFITEGVKRELEAGDKSAEGEQG